jgi:triosephosphate isomerase
MRKVPVPAQTAGEEQILALHTGTENGIIAAVFLTKESLMRRKIVAGNWKMNKTASEAAELINGIKKETAGVKGVDIVVCPPFTDLKDAAAACAGSSVALGAQNIHWAESGAYTGEISAAMLKDIGVQYVIVGHSERRTYFGETDETVNKRVKAALAAGFTPIVCVGETLAERDAGKMESVIVRQIKKGLADLGADLGKLVVAYEPVWAIGTGRTATPAQAQEVHALIRRTLAELSDGDTANKIRIQYGGSMKPANAKELMSQPDIDGGLIGGAALKPDTFAAIIKAAL